MISGEKSAKTGCAKMEHFRKKRLIFFGEYVKMDKEPAAVCRKQKGVSEHVIT